MLNSKYERGHLWPWTCGTDHWRQGFPFVTYCIWFLDINKMERTLILFQIISRLYDIVTTPFKFSIRYLSPKFLQPQLSLWIPAAENATLLSPLICQDEAPKAVRTFWSCSYQMSDNAICHLCCFQKKTLRQREEIVYSSRLW